MSIEAETISGILTTSDETTEFGFYGLNEMKILDMLDSSQERINDALERKAWTIVK